jgi:uncharacterized cofD-like protein
MVKKKNIVTIGGGTGTSVTLTGLKKYPINLSAIVSMMDSGGSTGRLIRDLDVHPMGDIRQALLALSRSNKENRDFFDFRFESGNLKGHNAGNLFLAGFEKQLGSFESAIEKASEYLGVEGRVIPVTLTRTELVAHLKGGRKLFKEHSFDDLEKQKNVFVKLSLSKPVKANPNAIKAIRAADAIVICPGNPLRSVLPNFLVSGIRQAIKKSKAPVIFCSGIMNKKGQTNKMDLAEGIEMFEEYIGKELIDYVIYNSGTINKQVLKKNQLTDELLMPINKEKLDEADYKAIGVSLLAKDTYKQNKSDVLIKRTRIRHDPQKLATIIMRIVQKGL